MACITENQKSAAQAVPVCYTGTITLGAAPELRTFSLKCTRPNGASHEVSVTSDVSGLVTFGLSDYPDNWFRRGWYRFDLLKSDRTIQAVTDSLATEADTVVVKFDDLDGAPNTNLRLTFIP